MAQRSIFDEVVQGLIELKLEREGKAMSQETTLKLVIVHTQDGIDEPVKATSTGGNEDGDLIVFLENGANIYNSRHWKKLIIRDIEPEITETTH